MSVKFITSGGGSGTVSVASGSGTAGRLPKFNSATALGDTFITATGSLVYAATGILQIPTGQLTMGTGNVADLGWSRGSAANWLATNAGSTNFLQLGSSGILLGSNRQVIWTSTSDPAGTRDTGIRRDAAGSISISDSGAGHGTGFGLGTATPHVVGGETIDSAERILHIDGPNARYGILAVTGANGSIIDFAQATAGRHRILVTATSFTLSRLNNTGTTLATLLSTSTDTLTLGSASVAGLVLNPGTDYISLPNARIGNATGALLINHANATNLLYLGSSGVLLGSNREVIWSTTSDPTGTRASAIGGGATLMLQGQSGILLKSSNVNIADGQLWVGVVPNANLAAGRIYAKDRLQFEVNGTAEISATFGGGMLKKLNSGGLYFNDATSGETAVTPVLGGAGVPVFRLGGSYNVAGNASSVLLYLNTTMASGGVLGAFIRGHQAGTDMFSIDSAGRFVIQDTVGIRNVASGVLGVTDGTTSGLGVVNSLVHALKSTLAGNSVFSSLSAQYSFFDPNGANRDITLPTNPIFGHAYTVKHTGSSYLLAVKDAAAATLLLLTAGDASSFVYDGGSWQAL